LIRIHVACSESLFENEKMVRIAKDVTDRSSHFIGEIYNIAQ